MTAILTNIDISTTDYLLTCTLDINCPSYYSKTVYVIAKRLSEYESLYNYLSNTLADIIICPPPFISSDSNFLKNTTTRFLASIINSVVVQNPIVVEFITSQFNFVPPKSPGLPRKSIFSFEKIQDVDTFFEETWDKVSFLTVNLESIGLANAKAVKNGALLTDLKRLYSDIDSQELSEISKLKALLSNLEIQEIRRLEYQKGVLNDELIYVVRWLSAIKKSLSHRHYLLGRYDSACKKTSLKLAKLERLKEKSSIGSTVVDSVLEEFTLIKQEEGIARSEFRNISESLKPAVVYHMNEIELELIGIWGRWANFHRDLSSFKSPVRFSLF